MMGFVEGASFGFVKTRARTSMLSRGFASELASGCKNDACGASVAQSATVRHHSSPKIQGMAALTTCIDIVH